jgi:hypothetical protein
MLGTRDVKTSLSIVILEVILRVDGCDLSPSRLLHQIKSTILLIPFTSLSLDQLF